MNTVCVVLLSGGAVFLLSNFAALPTEGGEEEEEGEQRAGGRPKLLALDWEGLEVEAVVGFQVYICSYWLAMLLRVCSYWYMPT